MNYTTQARLEIMIRTMVNNFKRHFTVKYRVTHNKLHRAVPKGQSSPFGLKSNVQTGGSGRLLVRSAKNHVVMWVLQLLQANQKPKRHRLSQRSLKVSF